MAAVPGPHATAREPDTSAAVAPAPAGVPQPVVSAAQVKTLEDTLVEIVRPVVRQWVIDNMPRIVEEVAKQEVAKLPKPDA